MFLRIFLTLTLISTCCFGMPRHRPQHNIEGSVVDVYVYDKNPVNRQQTNGNVRCSGRNGNCAYVPNQTNQRYPDRSPSKGSKDEMIIVLVPDNYNPSGPYYPNFNNHHPHGPGLPFPPPPPYPSYPAPHLPYVHHRPQYPHYPTPNQPYDPSYVQHRPQYPTYPTPNQPYDPSNVNNRPHYPTPNQPYDPSNVNNRPHYPTPNQPYNPSNVDHKPDESYSYPSPNNNEQGQGLPSVSPSDGNQQDKTVSTGQRPTSPINGNQKQNPDSNCLFGNVYCNNNANGNGNQPNPSVAPTLIDTATITPVPISPIDKLPTTTMSVDDIIANVFDTKTTETTTTTTQSPVFDIDIRNL